MPNGGMASVDDPATWVSLPEALKAYEAGTFAGIGIMLRDTDLSVWDLDDCLDAAGSALPFAQQVVERAQTYVERSPSKTGLRIIGTGNGGYLYRKQAVPGTGMSVETFRACSKFVTITGDAWNGSAGQACDVGKLPDEIVAELEQKSKDPPPGKKRIVLEDVIAHGRYELFKNDKSRAVWYVACEMARRKKSEAEIVAVLLDTNNRISDHVYEQHDPKAYAHRQATRARERIRLAESGAGFEDSVALAFSAQHSEDLRFVAAWGKWLQWDGARWVFEDTLHAFHLARDLCRRAGDADHKKVANVVALARSDRHQAATTDQWDKDPWLLGTPKGTVDLRTGKLQPARQSDYITKIASVAPGGECPRWLKFLDEVMNKDKELISYLQRMSGYSLTGITNEHAIFFHHGKGGNGKSVFLRTIAGILSELHEVASMETFIVSKVTHHPTDLAQLRGARLVTAIETQEGKHWDEAKLKALTGGDPISARFMRQDFFKYTPQFKLQIAGNHKPVIRNVDEAIRRRMNLIPWTVTIPEKDRDEELFEKLKPEWPGILQWMIVGCLDWLRDGLKPPSAVTAATNEYLESQDVIEAYLEESCVVAPHESDTVTHLWDGYVDWAEACGEFVGTKRRFSDLLAERGFERATFGHDKTRGFKGLRCIRENAKKLNAEARRAADEYRATGRRAPLGGGYD
jgi:P4 family phage/plasmid primase-like protien